MKIAPEYSQRESEGIKNCSVEILQYLRTLRKNEVKPL